MRNPLEEGFVDLPEDVKASVNKRVVTVSGPKGALSRDFSKMPVNIEKVGQRFRVWVQWPRKREAAVVKSVCSHIKNMITGVKEGFKYALKVVHVYFPVSIKVEGDKVIISNFCGEREPRIAEIVRQTRVEVKGDDVIVSGMDKEGVGQTAANIEGATKVKAKDPRVFLDGIYVYSKEVGM